MVWLSLFALLILRRLMALSMVNPIECQMELRAELELGGSQDLDLAI